VKLLEVINRSAEFLARKGVDSPRLQVELLLAHLLQLPRLKLYLNFERELTTAQLDELRQWVTRRSEREPLQHIIGTTSFCGLEFAVNSSVLIPRPETESLAEQAWQYLLGPASGGSPRRAIDVGTGSGCLAVTLAVKCPEMLFDAVDQSSAALEVARQNAVRHGVLERIDFYKSDLFAGAPKNRSFELAVSNPPYIPGKEIDALQPEVRKYDPRLALDGGEDGLEIYRRLAAETPEFLAPNGVFMGEFGDDQERQVAALFEQRNWRVEQLLPDLSGKPRIIVAHRPVP